MTADDTTFVIPEPTADKPVFYTLPADAVVEGMTTDDGQTVLDVTETGSGTSIHVYTPSGNLEENEERQGSPELRGYEPGERADMADFVDTERPGREDPDALIQVDVAFTDPGDVVVDGIVFRPSGQIEEVFVTDLEEGDFYRNHDRERFFDVEEVLTGDDEDEDEDSDDEEEDEDLDADDVVVVSSNGNRAIYDSSAMVQRWQPYQ